MANVPCSYKSVHGINIAFLFAGVGAYPWLIGLFILVFCGQAFILARKVKGYFAAFKQW